MDNKILWEPLLDSIQEEQCVLCIGPGVYADKDGQTLEEQLISFLKEKGSLDDDIVCYPDGLFYFKRENKRGNVLSGMKRFFHQAFPEADAIFESLTRIPFSLILFLTPDNRYAQIAREKNFPVNTDYYFATQLPQIKERPSKNFPIVYNIFGSLEGKSESVILTYDDLFEFITNMTKSDRRSTEMRKYIQNARHFLCIGIPFEKWYMQLLLRILEMHSNKALTKYAANHRSLEQETLSFYKDQFDITFVEDQIGEFVQNLLRQCEAEKLIKSDQEKSGSIKETIRELVAENKLEDALFHLENYLKSQPGLPEQARNDIAHIKRRLKMNDKDRRDDIITVDDYRREMNNITKDLLSFINELF